MAGRRFVKKLDLGPTGNKIFLGLLYKGSGGSTVMLRNFGTFDQVVGLGVTGGRSLEVVDSFGNVDKVPVRGGRARLVVPIMPIYARLKTGQRIVPPKIDFGKNIAKQARYTYSGQTKSNPAILTDGQFQTADLHQTPWGKPWRGKYPGKVFNESPQTLDITFGGRREIGGLIIFGIPSANQFSTLLDYDLQYHDGKSWVTIEEVRTRCPPSDAVKSYHSNAMTWYVGQNFFVHRFKKPIKTSRLRLVVRRITRGCFIDMIMEKVAWKASSEELELREIEVYGPVKSDFVLRQATDADRDVRRGTQPDAPEQAPEKDAGRLRRTKARTRAPRDTPAPEPAAPLPTGPAAKLYNEAETAFVNGDLDEARRLFEKVVQEHPKDEYAEKAKTYLELIE